MIKIGKNIFIETGTYNNKEYVGIRRWYLDHPSGELKRGKSGLNISIDEFKEIVSKSGDILDLVKEKLHFEEES